MSNSVPSVPATLALADGTVFSGYAFGKIKESNTPAVGEVVFNTSMYGYQEIMSDPSYAGQTICFTSPQIGNVGCNPQDFESDKVHAAGVVIRDLSPIASNYRATQSLSDFLSEHNVMGIYGIDTRALVAHLRDKGAQMGAMACGESAATLVDAAKAAGSMEGKDYVRHVSCQRPYEWNELPWERSIQGYPKLPPSSLATRPHVVAVDCGIKHNILRLLCAAGFKVSVVPAFSSAQEIISLKPDALFISNGPGDPATLDYVITPVQELVGKLPIFGICLGHQILAQAVGGKTYKLKFGHRGGNHPVKDLQTGKVEITVQNHGFAVDESSLKGKATVSHQNLNDGTVEGLELPSYRAFSIQYHPEASPGPHDSIYLFNRFYQMVSPNA